MVHVHFNFLRPLTSGVGYIRLSEDGRGWIANTFILKQSSLNFFPHFILFQAILASVGTAEQTPFTALRPTGRARAAGVTVNGITPAVLNRP